MLSLTRCRIKFPDSSASICAPVYSESSKAIDMIPQNHKMILLLLCDRIFSWETVALREG
ncbi:MAG: hypothetical protein VKL59_12755 [Nostocaceae cyanobacterium]|nr:hypothetical protein [Nostocaceae cyanobacterium]